MEELKNLSQPGEKLLPKETLLRASNVVAGTDEKDVQFTDVPKYEKLLDPLQKKLAENTENMWAQATTEVPEEEYGIDVGERIHAPIYRTPQSGASTELRFANQPDLETSYTIQTPVGIQRRVRQSAAQVEQQQIHMHAAMQASGPGADATQQGERSTYLPAQRKRSQQQTQQKKSTSFVGGATKWALIGTGALGAGTAASLFVIPFL